MSKYDFKKLDQYFEDFVSNLDHFLPEDIVEVDPKIVASADIHDDSGKAAQFFHIYETAEKITLVNEEFIVWIVPQTLNETLETYILIATYRKQKPFLKFAFITKEPYNNSKFILSLLDHYLHEIKENEVVIDKLKKN